MMASIGRDNHIDIEIAERIEIALHIDCQQVDIPRISPILIHLEYRSIWVSRANPAWIAEAHTNVEQHERPLESRSAGPRLKSCAQFEPIRDDLAEPYPGSGPNKGTIPRCVPRITWTRSTIGPVTLYRFASRVALRRASSTGVSPCTWTVPPRVWMVARSACRRAARRSCPRRW